MKYILTLLLIFLFPVRFLIGTLPYYEMAWISSLLLYIEVALLGACFVFACFHWTEIRLNRNSKALFFLYIIYFVFIYNQVIVSPQIPRALMMDVPEENLTAFREFVIQTLSMILVLGFRKHISFKLFAKITVILTFLTFFAYFNKVDYRNYGILNIMDKQTNGEFEIITSFRIAGYMVFAFFCNYVVKDDWTKRKYIDKVFFYLCSIVFVLGLFITIKRGPIISFFVILGLIFYLRNKNKIILVALLCGLCILFLGDFLNDILQNNVSGLADRFITMADSGGSGRIGSDGSVYGTAFEQIKGSPITGSYFRLLRSTYIDRGSYPHNILLELLMTGGLLLSIPFFILLWKALRIDIRLIKLGGEQALPALCFLYVLLSLMTSSSLLFKTEFWVFLAILCSYNLKSVRIR